MLQRLQLTRFKSLKIMKDNPNKLSRPDEVNSETTLTPKVEQNIVYSVHAMYDYRPSLLYCLSECALCCRDKCSYNHT